VGTGQDTGQFTGALITRAYALHIHPAIPILTMESSSNSIYYLVDGDLYDCVRRHRERWVEEKMGSDGSVECVDSEIGLAWSVAYFVTPPCILTNYAFFT
jgi:hypothetical protein